MKCISCKAEIKEDAKFCPECGNKVIVVQKVQEIKNVPMIMKAAEAMEFLRMSRRMFYNFLSDKHNPIPFFLVGQDKRFITSELINWAKSRQTTNTCSRDLHVV